MVSYKFSRLAFISKYIEPLEDHEGFEVHTPEGVFRMTKAEFYDVFASIPKTMSYRDRGLFHYKITPQKAVQFLLPKIEKGL